MRCPRSLAAAATLGMALLFGAASTTGAADMVLVVNDGADSGFNDPTPVAPVGGPLQTNPFGK